MVIYELRRHMCWDDELRKCLGDEFLLKDSFNDRQDEALYLARVIQFSISRPFIKRDKETGALVLPHWYVPEDSNYVRKMRVPKCCSYFRGRENELDSLHDMLSKEHVVFVKGIAGIGKSELVYAYAEKYETEYRHILYVDYSGDLRNDIMQLLLDCQAALEKDISRQIELEEKALAILPMNSERNVNLAANINNNIALYYYQSGEIQLAKEHLLTGMELLTKCGLGNSFDALRLMELWSVILAECGEADEGLRLLKEIRNFVECSTSRDSMECARVDTAIAQIYTSLKDYTNTDK